MIMVCNKNEIYDAVVNVSRAVTGKSAVQVLGGIKLSLEGDTLRLTGYGLEIGIETTVNVKAQGGGSAVVDAKLFAEIIKKMPSDEITIEVFDNLQVKISGGETEYNIAAISALDYPNLPSPEKCESFAVPQSVLKSMINQTVFAASQSDAKPIIKGELFEISGGQFNLVALDGYRLAVRHEPVKMDKGFKFVIPAKSLSEISRLLKDEDGAICEIEAARKHVIFDLPGYSVYTRTIEGEYHPYKNAIPKEYATEVIIEAKKLIDSLERAMLLLNDRNNSPVTLQIIGEQIDISCTTSLGKLNDIIKADKNGSDMKIGFKCKYMLDALKACGDKRVKLLFAGSQQPIKIVPTSGDERYTYLVLPVRM